MSFDIFLQRFAAGEPAEVNRDAVRGVLETQDFTGPDNFGFYRVEFEDGVDVELSAKGLDGATAFTGCAFHVGGMSPHLVAFILQIAKAGDMVILPAMEDFVAILSSPDQKEHLPSDLVENGPEPVVCESSRELAALLSGGYAGWQKYLNQVLNQNRE
ncbi:MAG TPA: hypothetical protein VGI46_19440 [Candidatus Acidoferrum sp.]